MFFKCLLYFFMFFYALFAFAQAEIQSDSLENNLLNPVLSYEDFKKQEAIKYINILKNGALLVRIKSQSKNIEKYRKANLTKVVNRIEKDRDKNTKKLMASFEKYFDFCPVYFFYDTDSYLLDEEQKTGFFINNNLERDASIILDKTDYLIFDYGIPSQEKIPKQYEEFRLEQRDTTDGKIYEKLQVYSGSSSGANTYIVKNTAYEQLRFPFPYITENKIKRGLPREIGFFNERFHSLYNYVKQ